MSQWITALLLSPATGEQKSMWPWIVGGIGLVALAAFVVLSVMQKKKTPSDDGQPPLAEAPAEPSPDDVTEETMGSTADVETPEPQESGKDENP